MMIKTFIIIAFYNLFTCLKTFLILNIHLRNMEKKCFFIIFCKNGRK